MKLKENLLSLTRIAKNSSIYSSVLILQKSVGFFMLPLYTAYLSTEDYGIVGSIMAITTILNVLFVLALGASLRRFYYEKSDNENFARALFGTTYFSVLIFSFFFGVILFVTRNLWMGVVLPNIPFNPYMGLAFVTIILNPVFIIYQSALLAQQKAKEYGFNNILYFLINITSILIFLLVFDLKAEGVIAAMALTNMILFVRSLVVFVPKIKIGIDLSLLKKCFKYSLPLIPHTIAGIVTSMVDRLFINSLVSTSAVGLYNVAFQLSNILNIIGTSINQAFQPWFVENYKLRHYKEINTFINLSVQLLCVLSIGIIYFSKELLILLVTPEYRMAFSIIPILSVGVLMNAVYYFYSSVLFYDIAGNGTRKVAAITITMSIISISINFLLIEPYGIFGAAFASLIAKIFLLSATMIVSIKEKQKVKFDWIQHIFLILGTSLVSLIVYIPISQISLFVIKLAIFGAVGLIFFIKNKVILYSFWNNFSRVWLK